MTTAPVALYDIDPDSIASLVQSCPAVAGLSAGPFGAARTYLPGRSVTGVRIGPDAVEIHVVVKYGATVQVLVGQIRRVLAGQVRGRAVDVVVQDVAAPAAAPLAARSTELRPGSTADPLGSDSMPGRPARAPVGIAATAPALTLPPPPTER